MTPLVQITAQYSNAVLVAILPYVSDFAQKLDVPVHQPITTNMVRSFKCDNRKGEVGGMVVLTNGFQFVFLDGRVCIYRSPWSFFSLQDPDLLPRFYGTVRITETNAVAIARTAIRKLGYGVHELPIEAPPEITPPEEVSGHVIPRYRLRWLDSLDRGRETAASIHPVVLDVEIDASNGHIQMLSLIGTNTARRSPAISVSAPDDLRFTRDFRAAPGTGRQTEPVSPAYATAFLNAILPKISDFVAGAGLEVSTPISTNAVDESRYACRMVEGSPYAQVYLTNGDRFNFEHGHVVAFYAHDAFLKFPKEGNPEDFVGTLNMTTNEVVALAERALRGIGYRESLPTPSLDTRIPRRNGEFTRRIVRWWRPNSDLEIANCEVDLEHRSIKSLYCDDGSLQRDPPKIDSADAK
jgi:hypothetical protein